MNINSPYGSGRYSESSPSISLGNSQSIRADAPIYFDNAATTFPKPESVLEASEECMRGYCGNAGRGSHTLAMKSAEKVFETREKLSSYFGATPENIVFTLNTTYALNMAIKGTMARGGHILISNMEHNSVLRPVARLARDRRIKYDTFGAYDPYHPLSSKDITSNILKKLRPDTRAVVCIHSSNICSYCLPIAEIGAFCRRHGLIFIVDAAQSAGHISINMERDNIDILCMPAHKGLYAPQGLGIMMLRRGLTIDTLTEGGNGVNSLDIGMGSINPERYEGGTLCTPAIAGLSAALDFLSGIGEKQIHCHECELWMRAYDRLSNIEGVMIYDDHAGSILLFNISSMTSDSVGMALSKKGFCLRTGFHCAPLAHKALCTPDGGAVRMGLGLFNTFDEVDALCDAVEELAQDQS